MLFIILRNHGLGPLTHDCLPLFIFLCQSVYLHLDNHHLGWSEFMPALYQVDTSSIQINLLPQKRTTPLKVHANVSVLGNSLAPAGTKTHQGFLRSSTCLAV